MIASTLTRRNPRLKPIAATVLIVVVGLACSFGQSDPPEVSILAPANDEKLFINREIMVQSVSVSPAGIRRVELWVNGEMIDVQMSENPSSFTALHPWTPEIEGTYLLEVRAFDPDERQSSPAAVQVSVANVPVEAVEEDVTVIVIENTATLTTKTNLNVRSGPSTNFTVLGTLQKGESAEIIGVNQDESWWQISYPNTAEGIGWVSTNENYSEAINTDAVPVIQHSSVVPAEIVPTTIKTQDTPPVINYFWAEPVNISAGESVILAWDLVGADSAHIYPGGEAGVPVPGTLRVYPTTTTSYRLVAGNSQGEVEVTVTVTVTND